MEVGDVFYSRKWFPQFSGRGISVTFKFLPNANRGMEWLKHTRVWVITAVPLEEMQLRIVVRKLKTTTNADSTTNDAGEADTNITKDSHLLQPPKGGQDGHAE